MRRETGEALLAGRPELGRGGSSLSSLVSRVVDSRGLTVVDSLARKPTTLPGRGPALALPLPPPLAGLVSAPPAGRSAGKSGRAVGGVALLGAHGGAGVSSLLRAGLNGFAVDSERRWPPAGVVLLVARTSTSGLEWARDLARQHASRLAGDVELLGLVLVADAPGRLPARTAGLRDLVSAAFPRTWHVPWIEEWRLAAATEPLPLHPNVQHLIAELARLSHHHLRRTTRTRTTRTRGDLP